GSSKILLRGHLGDDGLYQFDSPLQHKSEASSFIPHKPTAHSVFQANNGVFLEPNSSFSVSKTQWKVHRLPSVPSTANYTKPLELIFCDLWGPAPVESFDGYSYFLTCVDAYTRFTWIFPLKLKSHTLMTFKNFKSMVELQYNLPIKSVQTDGGGEFRPFTQFLTPLGIVHRLTCPHTHHQNGSVERKHRHIVETDYPLLP
ncbi:histone deacetylase, partial [Trifolium pratense]